MALAYIALGSNLCEPIQQVTDAIQALNAISNTTLVAQSSLYRSAPVGYDNQPDFINAVASVETTLSPEDLLTAMFDVENAFGRERPFPNAPRILDLDLLLYEQKTRQTKRLVLPHPRMHTRAFVMHPLAEIAPDLVLPAHGNVQALAQTLCNQEIEQLPHSGTKV